MERKGNDTRAASEMVIQGSVISSYYDWDAEDNKTPTGGLTATVDPSLTQEEAPPAQRETAPQRSGKKRRVGAFGVGAALGVLGFLGVNALSDNDSTPFSIVTESPSQSTPHVDLKKPTQLPSKIIVPSPQAPKAPVVPPAPVPSRMESMSPEEAQAAADNLAEKVKEMCDTPKDSPKPEISCDKRGESSMDQGKEDTYHFSTKKVNDRWGEVIVKTNDVGVALLQKDSKWHLIMTRGKEVVDKNIPESPEQEITTLFGNFATIFDSFKPSQPETRESRTTDHTEQSSPTHVSTPRQESTFTPSPTHTPTSTHQEPTRTIESSQNTSSPTNSHTPQESSSSHTTTSSEDQPKRVIGRGDDEYSRYTRNSQYFH